MLSELVAECDLPSFMVYTGQDLGLPGGFGDPFNAYGNFSVARSGTAPITSAPTLVSVDDDDENLDAEGAGSNQTLSSSIDMDGTSIGPAGSTVTVLGTCTITNSTTGEVGTLAVVQINDVNGLLGNHVVIGYASTITINPGDSIVVGKWQGSATSIAYDDLVGAGVCFASGTSILCPEGWRKVEDLLAGDLVCTESGPRPILWRASRQVAGQGRLAPVCIPAGLFGARRNLLLSPDHRLLLQGAEAQLLFGCDALWMRAGDLLNDKTIRQRPCAQVGYHHLLLDGHYQLNADGCIAESLDPLACADATVLAAIPPHLLQNEYCRHPTLGPLEARAASAYSGAWTTA